MPRAVVPDPMTETADGRADALALRDVVQAITGLETFEATLRRKVEGILAMVMGMTLAAIVAGMTAGILVAEKVQGFLLWPLPLALPFLAFGTTGVLVMHATWRAAALRAPRLTRGQAARRVAVAVALVFGLFVGTWLLLTGLYQGWFGPLPLPPVQSLFPLFLGLLTVGLVLANVIRLSPEGRRMAVAVGGAQVALAVAIALAPVEGAGVVVVAFLGLLAMPGTWIVGGLVHSLRA